MQTYPLGLIYSLKLEDFFPRGSKMSAAELFKLKQMFSAWVCPEFDSHFEKKEKGLIN